MAIYWDEAQPSDGSAANLADDEIRSLKSSLAVGLANAMYWPGSGGASAASAGQPLLGVWRAFYDTESKVSAYANGAMLITSDTSRLFGVGSASTMFLGSARAIEYGTFPGVGKRWVEMSGAAVSGTAFTFGVTYMGLPAVTFSVRTSVATFLAPVATAVSVTGATVVLYNAGGAAPAGSETSVYWRSLGTVSF